MINQSDWGKIGNFNENSVFRNIQNKEIIIVTINDNKIYHENINKEVENKIEIKAKQAIFLSRHRSKSAKPTLTTHAIGNFSEAKFGGLPETLSVSSPQMMTSLLRLIKKNADSEKMYHSVGFEVTHHGPYMDIPSIFAEVGSDIEEWNKIKPSKVIAKSLLELLKNFQYEEDINGKNPVIVGIGGGHYAPRFTEVALKKKVAFGHMIPKYQIKKGEIEFKMIDMAIQNTPNCIGVYLDRKSFKKSEVTKFNKYFEKNDIKSFSSKEFIDL